MFVISIFLSVMVAVEWLSQAPDSAPKPENEESDKEAAVGRRRKPVVIGEFCLVGGLV